MGLAEVLPGISGATVALAFGIYRNLLDILSNLKLNKDLFSKNYWMNSLQLPLLIVLLISMAIAILLFANLLTYLIQNHEASFRSGIAVLMIFIALKVADFMKNFLKNPLNKFITLIVGINIGLMIIIIDLTYKPAVDEAYSFWFLVVSGFIAFSFFIIPGISGSAILVVLGIYPLIIDSISGMDLHILSIFAIGCICSLLLMPKIISKIYYQYQDSVNYFFSGLIFISGFGLLFGWLSFQ